MRRFKPIALLEHSGFMASVMTVVLAALWMRSGWWPEWHWNWEEGREWRIGADSAAPYFYLREDGTVEGLSVDVLNEAARRRGVKLKWVRVEPPETLDEAFAKGKVDLWPAVAMTPARTRQYQFTEPWLENSYGLLTRAGVEPPLKTAEDVRGRRVAILGSGVFTHLTEKFLPQGKWIRYPGRRETVEAMCRGEADAAVVEVRFLETIMMERPPGCEHASLRLIMIPGASTQLRIMSTAEARQTAGQLRSAITKMAQENYLTGAVERWSALASQDIRSAYQLEQAVTKRRQFQDALLVVVLLLLGLGRLYRRAHVDRLRAAEAQAAAERANTAKSEFLANMSHELRTPLNAIVGLTQLVIEAEMNAGKRKDLEAVKSSAGTLLQIINEVLDLARIEAGRMRLEEAVFDLRGLGEEVIALFRPQARTRGIGLRLEYPRGLGRYFVGDGLRVRQVLTNLVGNSMKFTERGEVAVEVERGGKRDGRRGVRITVRDTGIGIESAMQQRVFEKFEQGHASANRTYGGTGLGLAICHELVQLMGGRITVESTPGAGSAFSVELWLSRRRPGREARVEAPAKAPERPARILLAEDNALNRTVVLRSLDKLHYHVDVAANGEDAVALWRANPYDLILMDIQMPGLDGYEATMRIRSEESAGGGRRTPIVAVTANALEAERRRCLAAGMDDYLAKPLDIQRLRDKVRSFTEAATSPASSASVRSAR